MRYKDTMEQELKEKQKQLMQEYKEFERMQTEHSTNTACYKCCQSNMDRLDAEAEQIRYVLESGCCE